LTSVHSDAQDWASECPDVKNYKWRKGFVKEISFKSGVKCRGSDKWWERRWWQWWGDMRRMRWTRRRVNTMRLTEWRKQLISQVRWCNRLISSKPHHHHHHFNRTDRQNAIIKYNKIRASNCPWGACCLYSFCYQSGWWKMDTSFSFNVPPRQPQRSAAQPNDNKVLIPWTTVAHNLHDCC